MSPEFCDDVCAVVVTYHPDAAQLRALTAALRSQVGRIVVVDNASAANVAACLCAGEAQNLELVCNAENLGVAAAQNLGAQRALDWDACRYVLFCDQDSLPQPHMVQRLRAALLAAEPALPERGAGARSSASRGGLGKLAAVGPWSVDSRTGQLGVLVVDHGLGPTRWLPSTQAMPASSTDAAPVEVSFLIASGSLVPIEVLRSLRGMRGNYFIDHVDTEWCLRARAAGYRLLVVPGARLHHRLGDCVRRIWFFGWRQVSWHAPMRDYYMFRNTLLLLRDVPLPGVWRRHFILRLLQFAGYFLILGDQRMARLRYMLLGLWHGTLGRSGRLRPGTSTCDAIGAAELDPDARSVPSAAPVGGDIPGRVP